jgi:CRISPR-associated protein Cas2
MYILVSYDIVDDRIRNTVMKFLKNFGERIQLSVFECDLEEEMYRKMKRGVEGLIDKKKDRVRYYRLCKGCVGKVVISGWGEIREDEGFNIV